jgi:UDP-glucose 4-epimerase
MPKILVTGGAGYIGSITAHLLARRGYNVVAVDDLSRGHRHNVGRLPFHKLSLFDTSALADLLAREAVDAVIHFAAYIAVGESTQKPELYFSNNVAGTLSLLTAMAQSNVKRLVFSSTAAVYGTPQIVPIPEDSPFAPVSPYGESKVMVEKILGWLDPYRGLRSIKLRYFNACGSDPESGLGEEHDPETHLIPLLIRAVLTETPIAIYGDDYETPDGTCIRDYIHVNDLAEAHALALHRLGRGESSFAANLGTGEGHSVFDVVKAVEEATGRHVNFVKGPRRAGDPPALVADPSRAQQLLPWKATRSLRDIVATAWNWLQRAPAKV